MEEQKTTLEMSKLLWNKINKMSKDIKKIEKVGDTKRTKYAHGDDIEKEVTKEAEKINVEVVTSPNWKTNSVTGETIQKVELNGKEFSVVGTIVYSIVDLDTGFKLDFDKLAGGKGIDPGQAIGSAETYSKRQWLGKTFKVEIEKEFDVSTDIRVFDRDGTSSSVLSSNEIGAIINTMSEKTGDANGYKYAAPQLLIAYNKHFKTNYGKLREFPKTEYKDLFNYLLAMKFDAKA